MSGTREDYEAKAADALAQLETATSEGERQRLKRAYGCFQKLASHGEEAAARAAMRAPPRIKAEKPATAPAPRTQSYFK